MCYIKTMNHISSVTIPMPTREKERLHDLALQYGFSLEELLAKILREISSKIPSESLKDYKNPKKLGLSLNRAMRDYHDSHVSETL